MDTEYIEINGTKYRKLNIKKIKVNDEDKDFITAEDTKANNSVEMKIILE